MKIKPVLLFCKFQNKHFKHYNRVVKFSIVLSFLFASSIHAIKTDGKNIDVNTASLSENQETKFSNTIINQSNKRIVTGVIVDKSGETVIGANVAEKGANNITITDIDGKFSLNVAPNAVLQISYIGYSTLDVPTVGKDKLNIVLHEDVQSLEELVVVGYGTQKKINLTASVQAVDMSEVQDRPVKSLSEALSASVPGLNVTMGTGAPTSKASLNIRGFTGMDSSGAPLVLVDNVPMDIEFVNPSDVENISILKDAAASAIYGSRAPNGVILITTKSGKKNKKIAITYDGSVQIGQPIGLHETVNGYDYAHYKNNGQYNNFQGAVYSDETIAKLKQYVNGEINYQNPILPNGKYASVWEQHGSTDNFDLAFKDQVVNTKHNISLSGGNEKVSYYAGLGYLSNDGLYKSDYDYSNRYSTIAKVDTEITKWLKVGTKVSFNRQESERPRIAASGQNDGTLYNMLGFHATLPAINDNGSINEFSILPNLNGQAGTFKTTTNETLLHFNTEINPISGLSIKADYTWKLTGTDVNNSQLMFGGYDADGTHMPSRRSPKNEFIEKSTASSAYHSLNLTAAYAKDFGKHNLSAIVGLNEELSQYKYLYAKSTGIISHSNQSISTTEGTTVIADDNLHSWATRGYFGRLSYNYDSRYLFEFSGRYDAASKYAPDSRWAFFPSVSAAYNIAREEFWMFKDHISKLKLKGSFGKLGNNAGNNYAYIPTLGIGGQTPVVLNGVRPKYVNMPGIVASDLTWTKPQSIGFGVETALFNNRLEIEYEWYQRTIYDQLGPAQQLPEVLGTNPPQRNNSVSETRGWELSIFWKDHLADLAGSPVTYSIRGGV